MGEENGKARLASWLWKVFYLYLIITGSEYLDTNGILSTQ
jgi:hypothetical protein